MKKTNSIWNHFIKALPLTLLAILVTAAGVLAATGTLDSPAGPEGTSSFSLEAVYQRLTTGAAGSQSSFTEPSVAPGTGSMHTIDDLMGAAPELDDENGAAASDVLPGATFWGLTGDEWGPQTGSMPEGSDVTGEDGSLTVDLPDGYYAGKTAACTDSELSAENILDTATIFGIAGSVSTGSDFTGEDGSLTFSVPDACYVGNTATAADSDLTPLNIAYGVNIFGVTGRYQNGWSVFDQRHL